MTERSPLTVAGAAVVLGPELGHLHHIPNYPCHAWRNAGTLMRAVLDGRHIAVKRNHDPGCGVCVRLRVIGPEFRLTPHMPGFRNILGKTAYTRQYRGFDIDLEPQISTIMGTRICQQVRALCDSRNSD